MCKPCRSAYLRVRYYGDLEKIRRYHREWFRRQPRRRSAAKLRERYGISLEQYDAMLAAQDGKCAICRSKDGKRTAGGSVWALAVDHDHSSGAVRGLLCDACNQGIGRFRDNPDLLRTAADYLEKSP